jgi:hypothetical protein
MFSKLFFKSLLASNLFVLGAASQSISLAMTTIANVSVSDTELVRAARDLARSQLKEVTFNHVMRSWLFAATLQSNLPSLYSTVDPETLAIAAILHDLGLDNTSFVSQDKRFEVDGAIAAPNWTAQQQKAGLTHGWDDNRLQLVWDSIALHAEPSFSQYKQPTVALTSLGTACDFGGPNSDNTKTLTWNQYNAIVEAYPRLDLKDAVISNTVSLCRTKPQTTFGRLHYFPL